MENIAEYDSPAKVGDKVFITGTLCNTNNVGGTEILKHKGVICEVTRSFWDYETGWRFVGRVINQDDLKSFREQATTGLTPQDYKEKYSDNSDIYKNVLEASKAFDPGTVYFSEFGIESKPEPTEAIQPKAF